MSDPVAYVDAENNAFEFETEDAGGGKTRNVHGLPSTVVAIFTAIKTATEAVSAIITAGKLGVADASAAAIAAIISAGKLAVADSAVATKLDTLHTDLGTTIAALLTLLNGYVDGLEGFVDGVETLITSSNTKLDTIATNQGVPAAGPKFGQNTDIDASSEDLGSQACSHGAYVKNMSTAGQKLYLSHTTATSSNGWELSPGEISPFIECTDISQIKAISDQANAAACWVAF